MGAGPGRCKKCSRGYQQVGSKCLGESSAKRGWSMGKAREGRVQIETVGCRAGSCGTQHPDLFPPTPSPHPQMWMSVRPWCVQERTSSVKTRREVTAVSVSRATDRRTASARRSRSRVSRVGGWTTPPGPTPLLPGNPESML